MTEEKGGLDRYGLKAIFNRNFNVVAVINLLIMTAYYMIFVTGTLYVRNAYDVSLSVAGFSSGIMVIGCLAGRFIAGSLLGCRPILLAGLVLYTGSVAAFFLAGSLPLLFLQRLFTGIAVGVTGTATGTIVAYVVPRQYHGLGISLFTMSTALALAAGPFLGITLMSGADYVTVVWTALAAGAGCLAVFCALQALPSMLKKHRPLTDLYSYIDPRVVRFSLVALVACLGYGCVQAFLTAFAEEKGLTWAARRVLPRVCRGGAGDETLQRAYSRPLRGKRGLLSRASAHGAGHGAACRGGNDRELSFRRVSPRRGLRQLPVRRAGRVADAGHPFALCPGYHDLFPLFRSRHRSWPVSFRFSGARGRV